MTLQDTERFASAEETMGPISPDSFSPRDNSTDGVVVELRREPFEFGILPASSVAPTIDTPAALVPLQRRFLAAAVPVGGRPAVTAEDLFSCLDLSNEAASVVIATLQSTLPAEPMYDDESLSSLSSEEKNQNQNTKVFVQDLMLFLFAQTFVRPRAQSFLRESGGVLETGPFEDDVGSLSERSFTFGSPTRSPARRRAAPSPKKGGKEKSESSSESDSLGARVGTSLHALFAAHHFNAACGLVVEDPAKIGTGGPTGGLTELTAAEADRLGYLFRVVGSDPAEDESNAVASAEDGAERDFPAGLPEIPGAPGSNSSISHRCGLFAGGDKSTVPAAALREWLVSRLAGARFFGKSKTAHALRLSPGTAGTASTPSSPGTSPGTSPSPGMSLSTYLPCSTTHVSAVIENVKKGTAIRRRKDFPASASVRVADCEDAVVYLLAPMAYASIVGCSDCVVVVGACSRAVRVERCRRVTIIAATKRLRVRAARDCVFHLGVEQRPVFLGECRGNVVAPYNTFYESLESDLKTAKLHVESLTKWSDPQCVFAMEEKEDAKTSASRSDRVVQRLAPDTFAPFIVPFRGESKRDGLDDEKEKNDEKNSVVTQANPFLVPDAYVAALDAKVRAVASLRGALRDARLDEHTKRELQATIQAHFKEWLNASGSMRQVYELARIERGESAL